MTPLLTRQNAAAAKVTKAIKDGLLVRPDVCELCGQAACESIYRDFKGDTKIGRKRIVPHHWNGYDNPFDIWWICNRCNRVLAGERFHSGLVTKEEAAKIIQAKRNAVRIPTGKCKGYLPDGIPCSHNVYSTDYCAKHHNKPLNECNRSNAMTTELIQAKFQTLAGDEQKRINREKAIIKSCGANHFWVETGCYADDPSVAWLLIGFAMMHLGFITSAEFYS